MPRDGTKNLRPVQTKEEAKAKGRNGGIKSGEARRKKRTFKQILEIIASSPIKDAKTKKLAESLGLDPDDITYGLMINLAQANKAIKEKDTRAAEYVRDTIGEKPSNQVEVTKDYEDLSPLADMLKINKEESESEKE